MTFIKINNKNIYYEYEKNSKNTIVFLHAWLLNSTEWKKISDKFKKKGFSILLFDFYGYGKSEELESISDYSIDKLSDLTLKLLKKLNIKNPILVGHSMGGMVAMNLSVKIDPKALILISTTHRNPLEYYDKFDILTDKLNKILKYKDKIEIKKQVESFDFSTAYIKSDFYYFLKGIASSKDTAILGGFHAVINNDQTSKLKKIICPTLIISGSRDMLTPAAEGQKIKKLIQKSKFKVLEGYHDINISNPVTVTLLINDFFKSYNLI